MQASTEDLDPICTVTPVAWLDVFLAVEASTRRSLRRSFPRAGEERIDDAMQAAALAAVAAPESFERAWGRGGGPAVARLVKVVAWRELRALYRKQSTRREGALPVGRPLGSRPAGQELVVDILRGLEPAMEHAAASAGADDVSAVRDALVDKLRSGDPDTVVSRRCGVRREYLNRAKRHLQAALRDELGLVA